MTLSPNNDCMSVRANLDGCTCNCFLVRNVFSGESPAFAFSEEHSHASYEFLFCKSGTGVQFINDVGHSYEGNDVFLMAPFVTHAHIGDENSCEARYSILFELDENGDSPSLTAVKSYLKEHSFFHYSAGSTEQVLIDQLVQQLSDETPGAEILISGLLSAIFSFAFYRICWETHAPKRVSAGITDYDRKFLINYFFDHMMDSNVRMEDLCEQVHLSPSQLNRVIRDMFGTTFKQKMIDVRICYAKYFLRFSDLTISEIAKRTNFTEDSNFSLFFKQHCGLTPSAYRKQFRGDVG